MIRPCPRQTRKQPFHTVTPRRPPPPCESEVQGQGYSEPINSMVQAEGGYVAAAPVSSTALAYRRVQNLRHGSTTVSTHSHTPRCMNEPQMNGPPEAHAHTHTTSRCSTSVSRRGSMLSPLGGLTRRVLRLSLAARVKGCWRPTATRAGSYCLKQFSRITG